MRTHTLYIVAALIMAGCSQKQPVENVQSHLQSYTDSLQLSLVQLMKSIDNKDVDRLQSDFEKARYHYKYLEPFTELYFPGFSDAINGPAIDESEIYEGKVVPPTGFQVVEEYIYPQPDTTSWNEVRNEAGILTSMTGRLTQLIEGNVLDDEHIFQAIRLQLLRISTLGIGGFDSPVALKSIKEAHAGLQGIFVVSEFYRNKSKDQFKQLKSSIALAQKHLKNIDFNSFDRATFIRNDMSIVGKNLYDFQMAVGVANNKIPGAVDMDKVKLFDRDLLRQEYFANPANRPTNENIVTLGKTLFFDPILSGNGKRACASCHQPQKGFSDGLVKSTAFEGKEDVQRNAPTVINSFYQRVQFYDSRIMFLEDQAADVIANPSELHSKMSESVSCIGKSEEYVILFKKAFGNEGEVVTERHLQMALAAYIRSLSGFNSSFDRYMRGEEESLPEEAISGFNLFMGKAKCSLCHFAPLFNGTIPPLYTKSESEVLGIPSTTDTLRASVDNDSGKSVIFSGEANQHAFKTSTVRNAALTAPYMHNGVYNTLDEVIDFYNRGGGAGLGIELHNQTLPTDKLMLTSKEKKDLIAFIHSLTDTTGMTSVPKKLPSFGNPKIDSRKPGGEY